MVILTPGAKAWSPAPTAKTPDQPFVERAGSQPVESCFQMPQNSRRPTIRLLIHTSVEDRCSVWPPWRGRCDSHNQDLVSETGNSCQLNPVRKTIPHLAGALRREAADSTKTRFAAVAACPQPPRQRSRPVGCAGSCRCPLSLPRSGVASWATKPLRGHESS